MAMSHRRTAGGLARGGAWSAGRAAGTLPRARYGIGRRGPVSVEDSRSIPRVDGDSIVRATTAFRRWSVLS